MTVCLALPLAPLGAAAFAAAAGLAPAAWLAAALPLLVDSTASLPMRPVHAADWASGQHVDAATHSLWHAYPSYNAYAMYAFRLNGGPARLSCTMAYMHTSV